MSEKYLISIAVGPVQDFIASARRSRDLWFGSWLLSEISKVVGKEIGETNLIFPATLNGNIVNKILAIIDNPQDVETNCREAIENRLKTIYEPMFKKINDKLKLTKLPDGYFKETTAIAQILDMTEFYWSAIPYDENKDNYKICRERVELLLNARKATREFDSVSWGSNAPKSSLDGQRESVIEDDLIKNDEIKAQKIFGLRKKERLCGVGVLKRLAEKGTDDSFFSTSHVASLPLLSTLKNGEKTNKAVKDYIGKIADLLFEIQNDELYKYIGKVPANLTHEVFKEYDGHLLFENRLADLPFDNQEKLDEAKKALKIFMKEAFGDENKKPLPYYALLLADGDRMGTFIDNQSNPKEHKKLSEALSRFATDVKEIVEKKENNGCLIYSGGDDVLAFLPLHTVLGCAKELSDKFAEDLKDFKDANNLRPTLSVGIAVVHHTEPLQESLETMRRAEKEAKSVRGKNALAIILSKRSGADTTIKGSWADDRKTGKSFDDRLKWFIQLHLDEALPDGVAFEIRDLWLRFKNSDRLEKPMRKDAVRIIQRKRSDQGLNPVSQDILKKLETLIMSEELSLEDLANEIIVARDFKRAYTQANRAAIEGETK